MRVLLFSLAAFAVFSASSSSILGRRNSYAYYDQNEILSESRLETLIHNMQLQSKMRQLTARLQSMCPSGMDTRIEEAVNSMVNCAEKVNFKEITICSTLKTNMNKCSKPIVEILDECSSEEAIGIAQFLFDEVTKALDYVCSINGEHILEFSNPCIRNISPKTNRCLTNLMREATHMTYTKTNVCRLITSSKSCLETHVYEACKNSITREAFMGFYNTIASECSTKDAFGLVEPNLVETLN